MKMVNCPSCGKKTPISNYCAFCGEKITDNPICNKCGNLISIDMSECPYCLTPLDEKSFLPQVTLDPWYIQYLQPFKSSLAIVLLLSSYSILQLTLGLVLTIFIPQSTIGDSQTITSLNLIIVILSNLFFIFILTRRSLLLMRDTQKPKISLEGIKLVFLLFFFSILFLEISLIVFEILLDFFSVPPVHSSPYDEYFSSTLNSFLFALLVSIIAPIFEEVLFRQQVLFFLEEIVESKAVLVSIGGIIFSLNHLAADLINGSLRYTIEHLYVVLVLGIVLGVVFYRFGLVYSIILHSLWNVFSFLIQMEQQFPEIIYLFNLVLVISLSIAFLSLVFFIYNFREKIYTIRSHLGENFSLNYNWISLLQNVGLIISYEIITAILLAIDQDIVSVMVFLSIQVLSIILGIQIINFNQRRMKIQKKELI